MSQLLFSLPLVGTVCLSASPLLAQVTTDGTVNTQVNQNGNVAEITGGETRGSNLFHSFQEFSIPTNNEAFFNNADSIANIFSRVTGGNISNLDGLIRANNTNLFLINPAGILFGENARLDIGGSFYGSTADSILFEDGEFSAVDNLQQPILTINAPIGLSFRDNPGDIVNSSASNGLQVQPRETIALLGGNVTFDGGIIFASSVNVEIGGLTETGTINFSESGGLAFPDNVARGDVLFTNDSSLAVSGEGGAISINARNFELNTDSGILSGIDTNTSSPNAQAGNVIINATENAVIDGLNSDNTSINNSAFGESIGNAGKVEITAKNISFLNGGLIFSAIENQGDTGDITLTATENIAFEGVINLGQSGILSAINEEGIGNTGNINITAKNLSIKDGASITGRVFGQGNSGNINVNISDTILIDGEAPIEGSFATFPSAIITEAVGEGNTGDINITAQNLLLFDGGEISADAGSIENMGIPGNAGNINITAETITMDGFGTKISSDVIFAEGNGGQLNIATDSLSLINGGLLSASVSGAGNAGNITIQAQDRVLIDSEGEILAEIITGTSNAGNIEINTSKLSIIDSGVAISTSIISGDGDAGNINISADLIEIQETSFIDAQVINSTALGTAGDINIETDKLVLRDGSQITANTAGIGNAGNLTINARESIELSGATEDFRGGLTALAVGTGNGGNISVNTNELTIKDGATVTASNFPSFENSTRPPGTGQPGDINIQANSISLQNEGRIEAKTQSEIGEAANINLTVAEDITLRNNSFISARALNNANGGNLTIDTDFIVAFPSNGNGNDIIASAERGEGGNIIINAESLLGIAEGAAIEGNNSNDIDASSRFSLDGTVAINTPDINPIQGASQLPINIVVPEETTAQACQSKLNCSYINGK